MKYKLINIIDPNLSITEQILVNRGIPLSEIQTYLHTTDDCINPPEALGEDNLRTAAATLIQTIKNNLSALVIIDSDADGFTSSATLINYLHDLFPAWVENHLTYWLHEGKQHGLNDHINQLMDSEYQNSKLKLVIIPDAGSNDVNECTCLKDKGINTIVLDHHLCDVSNPDAIVINNMFSF